MRTDSVYPGPDIGLSTSLHQHSAKGVSLCNEPVGIDGIGQRELGGDRHLQRAIRHLVSDPGQQSMDARGVHVPAEGNADNMESLADQFEELKTGRCARGRPDNGISTVWPD